MSVGKRIFLPKGFIDEIIENSSKANGVQDYAHRSGYIMCAGRNGRQYAFEVRQGSIDNSWIAKCIAKKPSVRKRITKEKLELHEAQKRILDTITDQVERKTFEDIFITSIDATPTEEPWFKFFVIPYTTDVIINEYEKLLSLLLTHRDSIKNYLRIVSSREIHLYSIYNTSCDKEVYVEGSVKLYDNSFLLNLDWIPTFEQKRFLQEKNKSYHVLVENASKRLGLWHGTLSCYATDNEAGPAMNPNDLTLLLEI